MANIFDSLANTGRQGMGLMAALATDDSVLGQERIKQQKSNAILQYLNGATPEARAQGAQGLVSAGVPIEDIAKLENVAVQRESLKGTGVNGYKDGKQVFDVTKDLRGEYTKSAEDFVKQRDAFTRINTSAQDPSAAGDLAVIFNFMKLLDPNSTVREGEFASAQNAGSIPQSIVGQYNRLVKGEGRLDPLLRQDFVGRSKMLFDTAGKQHEQRTKTFQTLAQQAGVDPSQVTIDLSPPLMQPQPTPQPAPINPQALTPQDLEGMTVEQLKQLRQGMGKVVQ